MRRKRRCEPNTELARQAGFLACLCKTDSLESGHFLLKLCCYPVHLKSQAKKKIHNGYRVLLHDDADSCAALCENDEIRVALKGLTASERDLEVR